MVHALGVIKEGAPEHALQLLPCWEAVEVHVPSWLLVRRNHPNSYPVGKQLNCKCADDVMMLHGVMRSGIALGTRSLRYATGSGCQLTLVHPWLVVVQYKPYEPRWTKSSTSEEGSFKYI